jgi:hypothetical protein
MNHYAILTNSSKFIDVMNYIRENELQCEVHLNRTRFWVPDELHCDFTNNYSGYCDFVPANQDLITGAI